MCKSVWVKAWEVFLEHPHFALCSTCLNHLWIFHWYLCLDSDQLKYPSPEQIFIVHILTVYQALFQALGIQW